MYPRQGEAKNDSGDHGESCPETTNCGNGAAEASIYEEALMTGRYEFFENTTEKLTPGAEGGVRGRTEEWKDDSKVVWSEVTGRSEFWDGSCRDEVCGAGMLNKFFTQTLAWYTIPTLGSLPVQCSSSEQICICSLIPSRGLSICTLHFSLECAARELIVTEPHALASICGCLVAWVCVAVW